MKRYLFLILVIISISGCATNATIPEKNFKSSNNQVIVSGKIEIICDDCNKKFLKYDIMRDLDYTLTFSKFKGSKPKDRQSGAAGDYMVDISKDGYFFIAIPPGEYITNWFFCFPPKYKFLENTFINFEKNYIYFKALPNSNNYIGDIKIYLSRKRFLPLDYIFDNHVNPMEIDLAKKVLAQTGHVAIGKVLGRPGPAFYVGEEKDNKELEQYFIVTELPQIINKINIENNIEEANKVFSSKYDGMLLNDSLAKIITFQ